MEPRDRDTPPGGDPHLRIQGRGQPRPSGARGPFVPGGGYVAAPGFAPGVGPAPTATGEVSIPVPWLVLPETATDFSAAGSLAGLVAAAGRTVIPGTAFEIPAGNVGVVRSVTFLVNTLALTSDVRFSLTANNGPLPGWADLLVLPRAAGSVAVSYGPDETYPRVTQNQTLRVTAQVADGGTYQVAASYHGWYYPVAVHEQFTRSTRMG